MVIFSSCGSTWTHFLPRKNANTEPSPPFLKSAKSALVSVENALSKFQILARPFLTWGTPIQMRRKKEGILTRTRESLELVLQREERRRGWKSGSTRNAYQFLPRKHVGKSISTFSKCQHLSLLRLPKDLWCHSAPPHHTRPLISHLSPSSIAPIHHSPFSITIELIIPLFVSSTLHLSWASWPSWSGRGRRRRRSGSRRLVGLWRRWYLLQARIEQR